MLGKYCSHAYAHATKEGASALRSVLKGSDMVAYEVFRSLGIEVLVRPVLEHVAKHMYEEYIEGDLRTHSHVGKQLSATTTVYTMLGDDAGIDEVYGEFPNELVKVTWMNEPTAEAGNAQFAFTRVSFRQRALQTQH